MVLSPSRQLSVEAQSWPSAGIDIPPSALLSDRVTGSVSSRNQTPAAPRGPPATRARPSPPLGIAAPAAAAAAPCTDTGTGNTWDGRLPSSQTRQHAAAAAAAVAAAASPGKQGGRRTKLGCPAHRLIPGSHGCCRATASPVSPPGETRVSAGQPLKSEDKKATRILEFNTG